MKKTKNRGKQPPKPKKLPKPSEKHVKRLTTAKADPVTARHVNRKALKAKDEGKLIVSDHQPPKLHQRPKVTAARLQELYGNIGTITSIEENESHFTLNCKGERAIAVRTLIHIHHELADLLEVGGRMYLLDPAIRNL